MADDNSENNSNQLNESAMNAIKKMADQQSHASEIYKQAMRFPNISEMFMNSQNNQMKAIQDSINIATGSGITRALKKHIAPPTSQSIKDDGSNISSARQLANINDDLQRTEKVRHETIQKALEFDQKVGTATIEQTEHLANLAKQNTILVQAMTQLLEHTVRFEEEKASGAQKQFKISVYGLWAAVISALISVAGLCYSIFLQKPPEVIVNTPPIKLESLVKHLEGQTLELKKTIRSLSKPVETLKQTKPEE
jgi:hypothetical protein